MRIPITKKMIEQTLINVDNKLARGSQRRKVYSPGAKVDQYYINNLIGELGEIIFQKSVDMRGYIMGTQPVNLDPFLRSDVCDFYTSKYRYTIDVKTVNNGNNSLIINKSIAHWRPVDHYVVVELLNDKKITSPMDLYKIEEAIIAGQMQHRTLVRESNLRKMYGKDVYFVPRNFLSPFRQLLKPYFYNKEDQLEDYYSTGTYELAIASIENGAVNEHFNNKMEINKLARQLRKAHQEGKESRSLSTGQDGHFNFYPQLVEDSIVSFAMKNDKFYTSLFINALFKGEAKAIEDKKTLVIPAYIENYIPEKDKKQIIELIERLNCKVEYVWSHNKNINILQ